MKKLFLAMLFFAGTTITLAQVDKQEDRQENDQDKIQQEPQRPAQLNLERTTRIEAERIQNEKNAKRAAKKLAKKNAKHAPIRRDSLMR